MRLDMLAELLMSESGYGICNYNQKPRYVGFYHGSVLAIKVEPNGKEITFTCDKGDWCGAEELARAITTFYVSKGIFPYLQERGDVLYMTLSIIEP